MVEARPTAAQRQEVARRAADACEYCYCRSQGRFSPDPFSVDPLAEPR